MDVKRANAMVFALSKLADIIKGADLEAKLSRFERRAKERETGENVQ